MIGVVFTEFIEKMNLRHFSCRGEDLPRTMGGNMRPCWFDDNPIGAFFTLGLLKRMTSGLPWVGTEMGARSRGLTLGGIAKMRASTDPRACLGQPSRPSGVTCLPADAPSNHASVWWACAGAAEA